MNELAEPLTKRLKLLARDSQNAVMNVLILFTGARRMTKSRVKFSDELQKLIDQVAASVKAWQQLEEILLFMEAKSDEISEQDLIHIVETSADAAMISDQLGEAWRLAQTGCAMRMLKLEPSLIPFSVRELSTFTEGPAQMRLFRDAIDKVLKDIDDASDHSTDNQSPD